MKNPKVVISNLGEPTSGESPNGGLDNHHSKRFAPTWKGESWRIIFPAKSNSGSCASWWKATASVRPSGPLAFWNLERFYDEVCACEKARKRHAGINRLIARLKLD